MRASILGLFLPVALLGCVSGKPQEFGQVAANALVVAKRDLRDAATAHKVDIQIDRIVYASDERATLVHAPLVGIERYKDDDFSSGAPIQLLVISSSLRLGIPNGSYVVTAQYRPGATSGQAIFTDRTGAEVARKDLIVHTLEQAAVFFPGVFPDPPTGPQEIPNITSTHVWVNGKRYVDCAGWDPYRVLLYSVQ